MLFSIQKRLMRMLTVDINQQVSNLLENRRIEQSAVCTAYIPAVDRKLPIQPP